MEWQWHQLHHMQIICTIFQTDNHASTPSLNFLRTGCSSWCPANSVKALKAAIGYKETPQIHPQTDPSPSTITIPSNNPFLDRPHSSPQTESGSNQLFHHNTLCGQTDGQMVQANVCTINAPLAMLIESDGLKTHITKASKHNTNKTKHPHFNFNGPFPGKLG